MPGLPKIVFERLRAKSAAPGSSGAAVGPGSSQGVEHLDANLLGAFVEKTLTARERTQVLNHLAQCAECRELAALALPAEIEVFQPTPLAARRGWSAWLTFQRGALAAALGAVVIAVVVHQYPWRRQETLSKDMRPSVLAGAGKALPQASVESPPAQPSPGAAVAKAGTESRESARQVAKLDKGGARPEGQNIAAHLARPEAKQQATLMAAARPPVTAEVENVPPVRAEREISRNEVAPSVGAMPAATPPAKLAFKPSAASESAPQDKLSAAPQAGAPAVSAKDETATVSRGVKPAQVGGIAGQHLTLGGPQAAATTRADSRVAELPQVASRKKVEGKPGPTATLWSISPSGRVQRSEDGGKTWEEVRVDDGVTYRVITASGRDVWAAGSGGALYHSGDGGVIWKRVNLNSGGNSLTEALVSIRLRDLQHLTVSTASGEQWVTEDGGQHWQREP
jgi:hypothetical protein